MEKNLMVSIDCITYNHEKYIAKALDSFLMQKTDFCYEILVHDDASMDCTAKIIREYEKRYPDIIKPIYQTENQYSKGVKVGKYNRERAKGKYIAICEGDDYWTDSRKLQKQVEYMEAHPSCTLCTHAAKKIDCDSGVILKEIRPAYSNKIFTVEDVIKGGGGMFATNSMLFPAKAVKKMPDFYNNCSIGDYPLAIYLALLGETHYLDSHMSVYRYMTRGSWTEKISSSRRNIISSYLSNIKLLQDVNKYTGSCYAKAINETIAYNNFNIALANFDLKKLKQGKNKEFYNKLTIKEKLVFFIDAHLPALLKFLLNIEKRIKRQIGILNAEYVDGK